MSAFTTLLLMVVLFVFLIFPHELGHFIVAKLCKVQVNEFAFGMGPTLLKRQGKETLYSIRAIPIGGFCAMEGEDTDEANDNPRAFNNKKWWQKILILLAGASMNIVIAIICLTAIGTASGSVTTTLEAVPEDGPAYSAGIRPGDKIISVDEKDTKDWAQVVSALDARISKGEDVTVKVKRGGETLEYKVTPTLNEEGAYKIGIQAGVSHNVFIALKNSFAGTKELATVILKAFKGIFQSSNPLNEVSGPIGMVQIVDETRTYGPWFFVYLVAMISVNLAIFNLLPFPALDGGRIIFVIVRLITGKAISDKVEGAVHAAGMVFLLVLAVVIAGNDLWRLFK